MNLFTGKRETLGAANLNRVSDRTFSPNLLMTNSVNAYRAPSFAYWGSKTKQAPAICASAPPTGDIFAEVFAGRGNVFWQASSVLDYAHWWLNDTRTGDFFSAIKRVGHKVVVPERDGSSSHHLFYKEQCRRLSGKNYSDEARVLEPYLTRNGGGYLAVGARTSGGGPGAEGYTRSLRQAHQIMHATNPVITNWDYEQVLECLGPNDFAMVDPPYIGASVGSYGAADLDHKRLIIWLKYAKFRWILCEYPHLVCRRTFGQPFWSKRVHRPCHPDRPRYF